MADPVIITCPADAWTKVATNVTAGIIHRLSVAPNVYKQTFRDTGEPAPANDDDAVLAFASGCQLDISSSAAIDVYIKAVRVAGEVRADL